MEIMGPTTDPTRGSSPPPPSTRAACDRLRQEDSGQGDHGKPGSMSPRCHRGRCLRYKPPRWGSRARARPERQDAVPAGAPDGASGQCREVGGGVLQTEPLPALVSVCAVFLYFSTQCEKSCHETKNSRTVRVKLACLHSHARLSSSELAWGHVTVPCRPSPSRFPRTPAPGRHTPLPEAHPHSRRHTAIGPDTGK